MVKDSLLHAIKEEYVEAVELLLEWEEKIHVAGEPYVSRTEPRGSFLKAEFILVELCASAATRSLGKRWNRRRPRSRPT